MPSTIGDYEHYRYIFHDTLGTQFTAPAVGDVTVKVDGKNAVGATVAIAGNEITVTFADIKDGNTITASSVVTVEYSAVLNKTAQIGLSGQENAVKLEYSNDSTGMVLAHRQRARLRKTRLSCSPMNWMLPSRIA